MTDQDRRNRDLELLKGAVMRDRGRKAANPNQPKPKPSGPGMMYRGQPVAGRGDTGGRAPGAPGSQNRSSASASSPTSDVKEALSKLTSLFNDGLISQSEYDAKRSEILDRI